MSESAAVLIDCLVRVTNDGLSFDAPKIEEAIARHADGEPLSATMRMRLTRFLEEIRWHEGDYFSNQERVHADNFFRSLHGNPHPSRSTVALAIPRRKNQAFDLLIYEPRDSLENLYQRGRAQGIGTEAQHHAIEKMLWLRPLDPDDYRLATAFLEELSQQGIKGKGTELAQARFLLDLLAPGHDPHALVARLKEAGLPHRIRRITGPHPSFTQTQPAAPSLDEVLVQLSRQLREAAQEGDASRVARLTEAVKNVTEAVGAMRKTGQTPAPSIFAALKGTAALSDADWKNFDQLAAHPIMNVALIPLGVAEHILASVVMRELSWEESIDEALDVLVGSAVVGGSIWGTAATLGGMYRLVQDKKLGATLKKINAHIPPHMRAYLVPALFLAAVTYIALRQNQDLTGEGLPIEEAGDYRWRFLEEMAESMGVQLAATGASFWILRKGLTYLERVPRGRLASGGVLAVATGAGMLAQEIFASWRRQRFRQALKAKTYREALGLTEVYLQSPPHQKLKLENQLDRKLAILIALNILDSPSIAEGVAMTQRRAKLAARLKSMGYPEDRIPQMVNAAEEQKPLTPVQIKIARGWIQRMGGKSSTAMLPVTMLPAQRQRIVSLWERELSDFAEWMITPIPLHIQRQADGTWEPEQFRSWGMAHTMALLHRYVHLRETAPLETIH